MATLDKEKVMDQYFESIKDKYPDLTRAELSIIIQAPFAWLKKMMRQVQLPTVRLKYLGVFTVFPGSRPKEPFGPEWWEGKHPRWEAKYKKLNEAINYHLNKQKNGETTEESEEHQSLPTGKD